MDDWTIGKVEVLDGGTLRLEASVQIADGYGQTTAVRIGPEQIDRTFRALNNAAWNGMDSARSKERSATPASGEFVHVRGDILVGLIAALEDVADKMDRSSASNEWHLPAETVCKVRDSLAAASAIERRGGEDNA